MIKIDLTSRRFFGHKLFRNQLVSAKVRQNEDEAICPRFVEEAPQDASN